jgi:hypothetical protein
MDLSSLDLSSLNLFSVVLSSLCSAWSEGAAR